MTMMTINHNKAVFEIFSLIIDSSLSQSVFVFHIRIAALIIVSASATSHSLGDAGEREHVSSRVIRQVVLVREHVTSQNTSTLSYVLSFHAFIRQTNIKFTNYNV